MLVARASRCVLSLILAAQERVDAVIGVGVGTIRAMLPRKITAEV